MADERAEQGFAKLSENRLYTHQDVRRVVTAEMGDMSDSTFTKILNRLLSEQKLFKVDRNRYSTVRPKALSSYQPAYSRRARALTATLGDRFDHLDFITSESVLLNEFLTDQIVDNTLFAQVERGRGMDVFDYLSKSYVGRVLYRPVFPEYSREWEKDCIVVLDLVSQAPRFDAKPNDIRIEKLLVDMVCDKVIAASFDAKEIPSIYQKVFDTYVVHRGMVMRYAARRGRKQMVQDYMEQAGVR